METLLKKPKVKISPSKRRKIDDAIETAKIYKTDVYWQGELAWSYCDWAKSKKVT